MVTLLLGLSACGQKGPLYLPQAGAAPAMASAVAVPGTTPSTSSSSS